jgi:hypothetical protein
MKLLIMQFSPTSCHFMSLWPKYSPQHPVLKHPQSILLHQCQRPSFTPIQYDRQNYSFLFATSIYINSVSMSQSIGQHFYFVLGNPGIRPPPVHRTQFLRTHTRKYLKFSHRTSLFSSSLTNLCRLTY